MEAPGALNRNRKGLRSFAESAADSTAAADVPRAAWLAGRNRKRPLSGAATGVSAATGALVAQGMHRWVRVRQRARTGTATGVVRARAGGPFPCVTADRCTGVSGSLEGRWMNGIRMQVG